MGKLVVIDGNSILNRAFYGIMGNKMLQTADGTYTNAVYGFLNIMFKTLEDLNPDYLVVAFDVKHPTKRHEMYKDYKGTRKGMPDELAQQMPIIKKVLNAMNITVMEMPGYEADDILGTLAREGERKGIEVTLLTGDRDSFQLATDNVIIRIPRTKQGKTETENYDKNKIIEEYGVLPKQLIEVKGLMGDTSDNIPGVPGVGEKTALNLIKQYESVDKLYEKIEAGEDDLKGKLKEKIEQNKDLAILSRTLGTIDTHAPIEKDFAKFKIIDWNQEEVLELFKELRFNRFIERFHLDGAGSHKEVDIQNLFEYEIIEDEKEILLKIEDTKKVYYVFEKKEVEDKNLIIPKKINYLNVFIPEDNKVYTIEWNPRKLKTIFENQEIMKCGYDLKEDYILLKQEGIQPQNMMYDARIGVYLLNATLNAYSIEEIAKKYLEIDITELYQNDKEEINQQTSLFDCFDTQEKDEKKAEYQYAVYAYVIGKTEENVIRDLKEIESYDLFTNIEMPVAEVLADMQFEGVYVNREELITFGNELKKHIDSLTSEIHNLAGEEFNVNSTKQLGEILFEKMKLTATKKTKKGYSTDVDSLEKIRNEHPIIEKILEYRQLAKLNSTYVEGMLPFINEKTGRVHTTFHQTVTATGRISSSDPNLQNIPTRTELGKQLRKVFEAGDEKIFVDADYSQIELRVFAHISQDEIMMNAFNNNMDIHTICASEVFKVPVEEVTKELRSRAKAVNFGIVYGISDFGLAGQIGISRKEAKKYIDDYLATYHGIREFMTNIVEEAKEKGYVSTLCGRRRYIPELKSNNYMVRKFGDRAAMNSPIQGTAADIMKIAMVNVYKSLKEHNLKSKVVLQVHDELLVETLIEEKEEVIKLLKDCMENAMKLSIPLKVEVEEGKNWYEAK